jgi:antibiotic biosynthesis monooxygenase (ABM) superfamily enzyme
MAIDLHQPSRSADAGGISTWRRVVVTWVVLFPLITVVQWLIGPSLTGLALPIRVAATCAIAVPTMTFVAMPVAMRAAATLLAAQPPTPRLPTVRPESAHVGQTSQTKPITKEQP